MDPKDLVKHDKNLPQFPEGQLVWIPPGFALSTEAPEPQQKESHLWDYIWMVWRKRWLVLLMFMVCTGIAILNNSRAIPIYRASAKLRIEPEAPKLIAFQGEQVAVGTNQSADFINTQIQVIQGRQLAQKVMDRLALFKEPNKSAVPQTDPVPVSVPKDSIKIRTESTLNKILAAAGLVSPPPDSSQEPVDEKEANESLKQMRINSFLSGLLVGGLAETEIITVSYTSANPRQCAQVVNTLCDEYIKWTYESKSESYNYSREWLNTKLIEIKGKLEKSELELIQLTGGKDVMGGGDGQMPQQIEAYRQQIMAAERELFQRQYDLDRFSNDKNFSTLRSLNDPQLGTLLSRYASNEIELDKLKAASFGEKSKDVQRIKAEMSRIEVQLQEALAQARKKAQLELDQVKVNYDYLKKMFDAEKARMTEVQKNMIQYNILKRDVETYRQMYDGVQQRLKEIDFTSGVRAGYASLIEPALTPMFPFAPNKQRTLMMGALIGIALGIGLIFFLDYMDTSVKDPEELEHVVRLPVLGCVSHCDVKPIKGEGRVCVELLTHFRPRSEFAESIRSIRTSIQYSRAGNAPKTILVTSSLPGEGKTTIAVNLAIALASRDKSVLLIDADLKKPSLNKLFDVDRKLGLTEVLTGKFDGSNLPETEIRNLFVMPAGSKPSNPVELLDSDEMRKFIERVSNEYDHVILDSAPALNMSDSSVLAPYIDGLILVVRPGKTPREAVRRVKDRLMDIRGNILGMVMNNPTKNAEERYSSRYGYGYGYGYGARNRNSRHYGQSFDPGFATSYHTDDDSRVYEGNIKEIVEISAAATRSEADRLTDDGNNA